MKSSTSIFALLFMLISEAAFSQLSPKPTPSQAPTFDVYISNESFPSPKTYRFDVWIKKTGKEKLEIANFQLGINVNSAFRGSGVITATMVDNSSMCVATEIPKTIRYSNALGPGIDRVNVVARFNPGCGSGTVVPDSGKGVRLITILLTTTAPFFNKEIKPELDFNFVPANINSPLQTKFSYYPPCPSTALDATPSGTFYDFNNIQGKKDRP